jgi:hypothetical protein
MARRRRRTTRRIHRVHRRGRRMNARRVHRRRVYHRRRRRNAYPMAGVVASMNPRRRRGRRNSPRRRHRRHGRRNALRVFGFSLPPLQSVAFGALGYVGTPMVEGFLSSVLPVSITGTTIGKYATRIASVLGLTWITKMTLGGGRAMMVSIGGGMYVATTAIKEFASGMLPAQAAAALPSVAYYAPPTLRAYVTPTSSPFHAVHQMSGLGAPNYGAMNTVRTAPFGGARIVGQRFRRFQ